MEKLRIETFISHTLESDEEVKIPPSEVFNLEELIEKKLPHGSMMREFYMLAKECHVEAEEVEEEIEIEEKPMLKIETFIEHALGMIRSGRIKLD